jgi:hypothetical protein
VTRSTRSADAIKAEAAVDRLLEEAEEEASDDE